MAKAPLAGYPPVVFESTHKGPDLRPGGVSPLPSFVPNPALINFGLPTSGDTVFGGGGGLGISHGRSVTTVDPGLITTPPHLRGPSMIPAGAHVGICVGHSRAGDKGAVSADGKVSEWNYNSRVAQSLWTLLRAQGIKATVFNRYAGEGYGSAMKDIARQLKAAGCTMAVELHFNAYKEEGQTVGKAKGFEVIAHTLKSDLGAAMIEAMEQGRVGVCRGLKTPVKGRGDKFLTETHCPAVLLEPFFADNPEEWARWGSRHDALARVYLSGIINYLARLEVKQ